MIIAKRSLRPAQEGVRKGHRGLVVKKNDHARVFSSLIGEKRQGEKKAGPLCRSHAV